MQATSLHSTALLVLAASALALPARLKAGTPGEQPVQRISIDLASPAEEISPLLFGHNLEVTRRGVWSGLSAEMVANRKFAAVEGDRPRRWQPVGGDGVARIDTSVAYAGSQSARVEVPAQGPPAGIRQQHEFLAVGEGRPYRLRIWAKTEAARKVRFLLSAAAQPALYEAEFDCAPGDWQLLAGEFVARATQTGCTLEVTSAEPGAFWLGTVSLTPADAFLGMRRDVIDLLKRLKPGCLRYPGGCYAEFYAWQDGLLPPDRRPPIGGTGLEFLFRHTDDTDTHEIGIDEFISLCREVGCEPAITVRLSENTPEDAAAWVEYCNGGPDTKWGRVRCERGHAEPYRVSWWFVGNELYSFGRGSARGAANCAAQSRLFCEAMLRSDPGIRLVACTSIVNGRLDAGWNTPLLGAAGNRVSALSAHQYVLDQMQLRSERDLPRLLQAPAQTVLPMLQAGRALADRTQAPGRKIGITYDEWNTRWGLSGSVPMGLFTARLLNLFCRESEALGLEMACYFMPINEGAIRVMPLSAELDTAGHVFELYAAHQGNRRLPLSAAPALDVCASCTRDRKRVVLTAVNGIDLEREVTFALSGAAAKPAAEAVHLVPRTLQLLETALERREERLSVACAQATARMLPGEMLRLIFELE